MAIAILVSYKDATMEYVRKCRGIAVLAILLCSTMLASDARSQTLTRNRDFLNLGAREPYLNYGRKEYDPYPLVVPARNRYDRLGNYLARGFNVINWEFSRPGFSEIDTRTAQYLGWFNDLIILSDSYRGWNYRVTLGEDIRTKLSDLTMKDPRFFGVVLDGASSDNKFSLLLSQGGDQLNIPKFSTFNSTKERSSVLIFGGHWETRLGSLLRLGGTYFNQHMANMADANGSFIKGDTPYGMLQPALIEIIVEDDSPLEPGVSAVVYDIDVVIAGESMGQPVRLTSIEGDQDYDPSLEPRIRGGARVAGGGRQVVGEGNRVFFEFQMPEFVLPPAADYAQNPDVPVAGLSIKSVRFLADVAGDYRILMRQQHSFFNEKTHQKNVDKLAEGDDRYAPGGSRYANPYTELQGDDALLSPREAAAAGQDVFNRWPVLPRPGTSTVNPFMQFQWDLDNPQTVAYTVVRSRGKSKTTANRRVVSFDYAIPTGQAVYGLDWDLTLKDITVRGEVVTNPQYFIFPVGSNAGKRSSKRAGAYYITAEKPLPLSTKLGGEIFKLDPDYSGNYDSRRGGVAFFTDLCTICPIQGGRSGWGQMQEMNLMVDNDDNDQYPDEFNNEKPSADKRESGVFPGLDENMDLVPDSDQNLNGIPDWTEPILFYDVDPPEFVYGLDFNNNGVVDFRENDSLPDYPYRRDRRGTHLFITKDRLGRWGKWLSLGGYRMKELAGGNKANAVYARYEQAVNSRYFGFLRINDDIKWVKDGIRNDVYIWRDVGLRERIKSPYPHLTGATLQARDLNTQLLPPTPDELTMRNSMVNTLFMESHYKQITGLNIINNLQWIRNSQRQDEFDDGTVQEDGILSTITMVNKLDYTMKMGNLEIRPMFKHLLLRKHSEAQEKATGKGSIQSFSIYTPMLRNRFDFTPKSNLQVAFQGFPFWKYSLTNRADETLSSKEWDLIVMMSNRSDHYGFNVASQFGFKKSSRKFSHETRKDDSFNTSLLFLDIVAGY